MKISKHKIKLLVAEAMRKSIKEEKSADQGKGSSASDNAKKIQVKKSDAVYNELMNQLNNIDVESDLLRTHVSQLVAAMRMYVDPASYDREDGGIFSSKEEDAKQNKAILDILTDPHIKALKEADPFYRRTVYAAATKGLEPDFAEEITSLLQEKGFSLPDEKDLAKSELYKNAKSEVDNSPLFKALRVSPSSPSEKSTYTGEEDKEANESKTMNENKIRAIIRHELIQSMRK